MIKTIIFDFGGVFIDLDLDAPFKAFKNLGIERFSEEMEIHNKRYETGMISTDEFIRFYRDKFPAISKKAMSEAWNSIILAFPEYRLMFIENLFQQDDYNLILLSNTNELHIEKVIGNMGMTRYQKFKNSFHSFYLSHEIHLRKPEKAIFQFILDTHHLNPGECLFIDDTPAHTASAKKLGMNTWNLKTDSEDIIQLFDSEYFIE